VTDLHNEEYYIKLRKKYIPSHCRVIFLLDAPSSRGKYFYDDTGTVNEPLFKKMMRCFIPFNPVVKKNGLKEFSRLGYLVMYAVNKPMKGIKTSKKRRDVILENLPGLEKELKSIIKRRVVKIIIVGTELREILEERLRINFYVINDGENVTFENKSGEEGYSEKVRFLFNIHNINLVMYC
jgi:hypothetical protein